MFAKYDNSNLNLQISLFHFLHLIYCCRTKILLSKGKYGAIFNRFQEKKGVLNSSDLFMFHSLQRGLISNSGFTIQDCEIVI